MDGFQVTRPIVGRAPTGGQARGDLTTSRVGAKALDGRAGTAANARATLSGPVRLTGRAATSSSLSATPGWGLVTQIGPIPGVEVHAALCYYPEGAAVARYDVARYDTAGDTYAGPPPCEDISCQVRSYSLSTGRDRPLERFRAGTATLVLDDPDGRYSPWRTVADTGVYGTIRPGIDVEIWVEIGHAAFPRFAGRVVAITDLFPETGGRHEVRFDCADYMSLLAVFDGVEQTPAGAGETSGARITRICDNAFYDQPRSFDAGTVTLQATTLAKNALDETGLVCDTELGVLFCDLDGTLIHRDRNGLVTDPRYTTVQATFGELDPELCYSDIVLASDTDKIKNVVSIANEGGTAVTREDTTSKALYGPHTFRRFDLIHEDPADSTVIADQHLDVYAYAANRIDKLTVQPGANPGQLPDLLPLGLLHRIQIRRRAEGFQVVADLQIQAINETVEPDDWTIEYTTFSAAAVFDAGRYDIDVYDTALYAY